MRCWIFCLFLAGMTAAVPAPDDSQPKAPGDDPDEPTPRETLGKLTLTLDPGGHTGEMRRMFFTKDGKQLVTAASDNSIRIWDVETGRTKYVLRPPGESLMRAVALFDESRKLAVGSMYREEGKPTVHVIYVISLADGKIERVLRTGLKSFNALAVSSDGKRLAVAERQGNRVAVWDLANLKKDDPEVFETTKPLESLAFGPAGRHLVVAQHDGCHIRDIAKRKTTALKGSALHHPVDPVAWSPDGKTVATAGKGGLHLWDPDGKLRSRLLPNVTGRSVAFSANSRHVLVVWNQGGKFHHRATIFDVNTGKVKGEFEPKGRFAEARNARLGCFSPDGKLAATAGGADGIHEIFLWHTGPGSVSKRLAAAPGLSGENLRAGWAAEGKTVSWRDAEDLPDRKPAPTSFDLAGLQFGPNLPGRQLQGAVTQQGQLTLKAVDLQTVHVMKKGAVYSELKVPKEYRRGTHMTFIGDDRVAVTDAAYLIFIFDTATGKHLQTFHHKGHIQSLAPSADGRNLLSVGRDQQLRIWAVREKKPHLLSLYVRGRDWIAWTPQGYYAATPGGERVMGFTVDHGIDRKTSFVPAERFRKVLYRPDVIRLVLAKGSVEEAVKVANAALPKEIVPPPFSEGTVDLEKLLPPTVKLTVVDKTKLPKVKLKVEAAAGVKDQPIQALRLLVDGRPLPEGQGLTEYKDGKQEDKVEWAVTLPPGPHQLAVLARSADASALSNEEEVDCTEAKEKSVLHILAVGINKYKDRDLDLKCAANDANGIAEAFKKGCKGDLFGEVSATILTNEQAKRKAILDAIQELRSDEKKRVKDNDLLVVFFAGHGATKKNQFYLLTHEADLDDLDKTALSGAKLREALGAFPCQVLLVMDACHSGAFGGTGKLTQKDFKPGSDDAARGMTDSEVGVAVMCAAMGYELSEGRAELGYGLFSKAVIDGLITTRDVPYNKATGKQTVRHLHTFVEDRVSVESGDKQHPFLHMPWTMESFALRKLPGGS